MITIPVEEKAAWDYYFHRLPAQWQDVHFSNAYARANNLLDPNSNIVLCATDDPAPMMQPFVMRQIERDVDIASCYGYGGRVGHHEAATVFDYDMSRFCNGYAICEYRSNHPMFSVMPSAAQECSFKEVQFLLLETFSETQCARRIRRGLAAAREIDVAVVERVDPEGFYALYERSMAAKQAAARWRLPAEYFERHARDSGLGARWYFAEVKGVAHRALLTIENPRQEKRVAYAQFFGSTGEHRDGGLDTMLYFAAAKRMASDGVHTLHLGGGLSNDEMDSLLQFKRGFGGVSLRVVRQNIVYDQVRYDILTQRKAENEMECHGRVSVSNWFPAYRRPFE